MMGEIPQLSKAVSDHLLYEMSRKWTPPSWIYRGRRPTNDAAYFENLTRCIFMAGLSWRTVAERWPNFKEAFSGFDVGKVALFGEGDVKRLLGDEGIIRNRRKIMATIYNATEFIRIAREHGGFQKWLDSIDKSDDYTGVVKLIRDRFKHVGETTSRIFLYTVGENIKFPEMGRGHREV